MQREVGGWQKNLEGTSAGNSRALDRPLAILELKFRDEE